MMDTRSLKEVTDWFKSTDLVELSYRWGDEGLDLRSEGAATVPAAFPHSTLIPVVSPAVGLFRWSKIGSPRRAEKGQEIAEGDTLGLVDAGQSQVEVKAPSSGCLVGIAIEEGKAVEYGQPLFFISPR